MCETLVGAAAGLLVDRLMDEIMLIKDILPLQSGFLCLLVRRQIEPQEEKRDKSFSPTFTFKINSTTSNFHPGSVYTKMFSMNLQAQLCKNA